MKKITHIVFSVILIFFCVALSIWGCTPNSSNSIDTELFEFELNEDQKSYTLVKVNYTNEKNIVIPSEYNNLPVTIIGKSAFVNHYQQKKVLESIVIPETVTEIGPWAFSACDALKEINIPSSVTKIGENAFRLCSSLEKIVIPDSVTELESKAFMKCTSLYEVVLSDNIEIINDSTFFECRNLRKINLPKNLKEIGYRAFASCADLVLSEFPSSLVKISEQAFFSCDSLVKLTFPESLEEVGEKAFDNCPALFEIYNKSSIKLDLGKDENQFGLNRFKHIISDESESYIKIDGDFIFYDDGNEVILVKYTGNSESLVLPKYPDNTKYTIWKFFLPKTNNIKSIVFSDSIGYVQDYAFTYLSALESATFDCEGASFSYWAFTNVIQAKTLYINTNNISMSGEAFPFGGIFSQVESVVFGEGVKNIPDNFFSGKTALKSVVLSSSIESIGEKAFYSCTNLDSIVFPDNTNIKEINDSAFYHCAFTSFVVPKSVTHIGKKAFSYIYTLKEITILGNVTVINDATFMQCQNLKIVSLPDTVEIVGTEAFSGCYNLSEVNIGENSSLHTIKEYAFYSCEKLNHIFLPKSLSNIEPLAFANCIALATFEIDPRNQAFLVLDENIYTKDLSVFVYKAPAGQAHVTIPSSVRKIGAGAFGFTRTLILTFEENSELEVIGEKAFMYSNIETIVLPKSVKVIGDKAFSNCQSLKSVSFEEGTCLERIEAGAFKGAFQYDHVMIPNSVKYIGPQVYYNVDEVYYDGTLEQWNEIVKEQGWIYSAFSISIYCLDQTIVIER